MKFAISVIVLFISVCAFPVSRIGGGKVGSLSSNFEMEVAAPFTDLKQLSETVLANGPPGIGPNGFSSQFIEIREFREYFSEIENSSKLETQTFFAARGWEQNQSIKTCVEAYAFENATATGAALTWGSGKGVILQGPATANVKIAIQQMIVTLKLLPGACAWK